MVNKKHITTFIQYSFGVFLFLVALTLLLSHFGYIKTFKPYVVQSGSMEPSIKTGSIVLSLPASSYQQNDVITFYANGSTKNIVTHRIEAKLYPDGIDAEPLYLTAGDANEDFDTWTVMSDQIVGKVVLTLPYVGFLVDFAQKPQGFILLVIIPATIVIYEELKNLIGEIKKFISRMYHRTSTVVHDQKASEKKEVFVLPKSALLVPIFGVIIFMAAFTAGYLSDFEKSLGNILGAASSFASPTASTLPSPSSPTISISVTPTPSPISLGINEYMVAPTVGNDWVELYSETDTDISGYVLDDANTETDMATIPGSTFIGPSSSKYYVVQVDARLNVGGDTISLYTPTKASLVESTSYIASPGADIAIGKDPDGILPFANCTTASLGASNNGLCP